ncbi:hypothetical protein BH23CHL5_BH23CHL5_28810 [soil metagenome]
MMLATCYPLPPFRTQTRRVEMLRDSMQALSILRGVGMVMDALNDTGLSESTFVICTNDHGPECAWPFMSRPLVHQTSA